MIYQIYLVRAVFAYDEDVVVIFVGVATAEATSILFNETPLDYNLSKVLLLLILLAYGWDQKMNLLYHFRVC